MNLKTNGKYHTNKNNIFDFEILVIILLLYFFNVTLHHHNERYLFEKL